jgi:hypothetical protein
LSSPDPTDVERHSHSVGENVSFPDTKQKSVPAGNPNTIASSAASVVPDVIAGYYFETLQQWEGVVTDVTEDEFVAALRSLSSDVSDKRVTIDREEISDSDQKLVSLGAVFYWTIGYRIEVHGQKSSISTIRFRRLPNWTRREIQRLDEGISKFDFLLK